MINYRVWIRELAGFELAIRESLFMDGLCLFANHFKSHFFKSQATCDSRVLNFFFIFSPLDHSNVTRICAKFEGSAPSSCRIMAIYVFFRLGHFSQKLVFFCSFEGWGIFQRLLFDLQIKSGHEIAQVGTIPGIEDC